MIWEHMVFKLRDKRKMGWGNVPPSSRRSPGTRPGRRCRRTSGTPCCSWRCCSQHRQAHRHLGNCTRVLVNDTPVSTSTNYPKPVVTENACLRKERKIQIVSSSSDECNTQAILYVRGNQRKVDARAGARGGWVDERALDDRAALAVEAAAA